MLRMVAMEQDTPPGPIETFWTPRTLGAVLMEWPAYVAGVVPREHLKILGQNRYGADGQELAAARVRQDINLGMTRLAQLDRNPEGAHLLDLLYRTSTIYHLGLAMRVIYVAADHGTTERTIYRQRQRALFELAEILGWRKGYDDDDDVNVG